MKTGYDLYARKGSTLVIVPALVLAATAVSSPAQGILALNTATGTKPRITLDGHNVLPEDNVFVQVLVAGASSLTGLGAEPFALSLGGANAGLFSKGTLTVEGKPPGAAVDVTIRAWDKDTGTTYETASVRATTTLFGFVLARDISSGGNLALSIVPAFQGLALVTPEPGTYALASLGLSALLFLFRK